MSGKNLISTFLFLFGLGCFINLNCLYSQKSFEPGNEKLYIVKHTWHTGILFSRKTASPYLTVLKNDFTNANYLEVGWGDLDFFTAKKGTVGLALKAVLWPTKSVLHVMPYKNHPSWHFGEDKLIEIEVSKKGFINLIQNINNSFELNGDSQKIKVETKGFAGGQFFLSKEKYHLFKTCNVWTAKYIKDAGYPISSAFALTSKNVMTQIKSKKQP